MLDLTDILQSDNILDLLDKDTVRDIANAVHTGYKADWDSRAEWNENIDKWMKLASQVMEVKNTPWPNASNVKYPLVTEACIQFSSRIYPAIVTGITPAKGRVVGFDQNGEKNNTAVRLSKHMNYQLLEEMTEWEEVHDNTGMVTGVAGCAFKRMYYCPIKGRNVSELIFPKDLVANYYTKDLPSSRRYSHRTELHGSYILGMQRLGYYADVDLRTPEQKQNDLTNSIQGIQAPAVDASTPYECIHQYTWLDLDDDGYEEPYIVTQEVNSKEILCISRRFDEEHISFSLDGEVYNIQPKECIVKYGLLPAPDGSFYNYGFGQYVGPLNHAVDSLINQLIDKGTLSNRGGGFISKGIRMKSGSTRFKIGEWMPVNATGDDLRKGVFPMPIGEPSPTLLSLATFLIQSAQRIAGTVDSQVGENPGQNQKATTTALVMEQGQKVFGGVYKRFLRSFKEELRVLYNLNKEYLEPEQYFTVLDTGDQDRIFQQDYINNNGNVVPAADPSYTNEQQKLQKAMAAMDLANQGLANRQLAGRMVAEAMELPNIDTLLQVPEPPPALEERQFEDESMRAWTEIKLKTFELRTKAKGIEAKALRDLLEGEAIEPGRQLEAMKVMLQSLDNELNRESQQEASNGSMGETGGETSES